MSDPLNPREPEPRPVPPATEEGLGDPDQPIPFVQKTCVAIALLSVAAIFFCYRESTAPFLVATASIFVLAAVNVWVLSRARRPALTRRGGDPYRSA